MIRLCEVNLTAKVFGNLLMPSKFATMIKCDGMAQMLEGFEHLLDGFCYIFFGLGFDATSQQYLSDAFDHGDKVAILSIDREVVKIIV